MDDQIQVLTDAPAVHFAARELARYLKRMTQRRFAVRSGSGRAPFILGVCEDLGLNRPPDLGVDEDWLHVAPAGAGLLISGSNPRSVLFAVYAYLKACGCQWVRPGSRGEIVPVVRSRRPRRVRIDERAGCKYRTVCIEGACSERHVRDLIDWMAKQYMNGYFIQFHQGTCFWRNWYAHAENPYLKSEPFDVETVVARIVAELKRRGLRFERMGHGWTCAALGIEGESWDPSKRSVLPPAKRAWLARVDGRRDFWGGVPLNTNLDYNRAAVRTAMADAIVCYAQAHPEVDAVHVWLADGSNNHDQAMATRRTRPADVYLQILNEVDQKLTAAGCATRIVFLIYVDLLWPPLKTRLANPERFILMFAPITRSYLSPFPEARPTAMKPFRLNRLQFPRRAGENLAYLAAWRNRFGGDGFDFDYHLMWALYFDLAQVTLARTLHADIQGLASIGLHGINSCQVQRAAFPHNLLMNVLARTLWDPSVSFETILRETFRDAFGPGGNEAARFFVAMSRLAHPFFEPVFTPTVDAGRIAMGRRNLPEMQALVDRIRPRAGRRRAAARGAQRWSWTYLRIYLDLMDRLIPAYDAYLRAAPETTALFGTSFDFVFQHEKILHPALDVFELHKVLSWRCHEAGQHRKALEVRS